MLNVKSNRRRRTLEDHIVDAVVYSALALLTFITIIPFLQVLTISVSPSEVVNSYGMHLIPTKFDFEGYLRILNYKMLWIGYGNTILRAILGTSISLILLVLGAYPLSKKYLPHRSFWTGIIVFTMYFNGGLIPLYLLIRGLGFYNQIWALVMPMAVNTFTLIIVRNFFMAIPEEIEESAKIDGAKDLYVLVKIVLPLSLPILATASLWCLVWHWNEWFHCMLFMADEKKHVLQLVLRRILLEGQQVDAATDANTQYVNTETMKMAALMASIIPMICLYPFLQKYFVKGVMVGSLKG